MKRLLSILTGITMLLGLLALGLSGCGFPAAGDATVIGNDPPKQGGTSPEKKNAKKEGAEKAHYGEQTNVDAGSDPNAPAPPGPPKSATGSAWKITFGKLGISDTFSAVPYTTATACWKAAQPVVQKGRLIVTLDVVSLGPLPTGAFQNPGERTSNKVADLAGHRIIGSALMLGLTGDSLDNGSYVTQQDSLHATVPLLGKTPATTGKTVRFQHHLTLPALGGEDYASLNVSFGWVRVFADSKKQNRYYQWFVPTELPQPVAACQKKGWQGALRVYYPIRQQDTNPVGNDRFDYVSWLSKQLP